MPCRYTATWHPPNPSPDPSSLDLPRSPIDLAGTAWHNGGSGWAELRPDAALDRSPRPGRARSDRQGRQGKEKHRFARGCVGGVCGVCGVGGVY